jgi:hypothetical protein
MVTNSGEQILDALIIVRFGRGAPGGQGVARRHLRALACRTEYHRMLEGPPP